MLGVTTPLLWYTTRASGIVALVLLSGSVVLGLITSARAGTHSWPRFAVSDLHRKVSLLALVFVCIHVLTTVVDTFVPIGWLPALVPLTSHYKTLWVTLGTVAFDLLLAVAITSILRARIRAGTWRAVHWASYLSWPIAVAHGIQMGTDMRFVWVDGLVAVCCIAVMMTFGWRVVARPLRVGAGVAASSEHAVRMAREGRVTTATVPLDRRPPTKAGVR
jgi:methionine sulfoxide reductase heme-binding subunit